MNQQAVPSNTLRVLMHCALILSLLFLARSATATDAPAGRNGAEQPKPSSVQYEAMPKIWISSDAFWIDDSRLIFSSSDFNANWHLGDLPRIVIFDTHTRKVELTAYSGYLYCYSAKNMIVDGGARAGRPVILVGRLGEPLRELEEHRRPTITGIDCESIELKDGEVTIDLGPGDGRIRFAGGPSHIASDAYRVEFVADDGKVTGTAAATSRTLPAGNRFVYLPWSRRYMKQGAIGPQHGIAGSFVDPAAASITPVPGPTQLTEMADSNMGNGDVYASKAGLLWRFRAYAGRSRFQGLFLQTASGLERVDDHDVWAPSNVSPDGCKFFYGRVAGDHAVTDPFEHRDSYDVVLVNVCNGETK